MRPLRSEQHRVHDFSSGLPLSGGRPGAVRAAARQNDSQVGDPGSEAVAAGAGRGDAGAAWEVRADSVSPGTEFEGDAGRTARLQRGLLAGADLIDGQAGRLA